MKFQYRVDGKRTVVIESDGQERTVECAVGDRQTIAELAARSETAEEFERALKQTARADE